MGTGIEFDKRTWVQPERRVQGSKLSPDERHDGRHLLDFVGQ
jgi:hypothetical protein